MSNKPVETVRDGNLSASIWENESEKGIFHSVTFQRVYTDSEDNTKNSSAYSGAELLRIAELARTAYQVVGNLRKS